MILKQEKAMMEIEVNKSVPEIGVPYKKMDEKIPSQFYKLDPSLSQAIAGYQEGLKNPYVEKLIELYGK